MKFNVTRYKIDDVLIKITVTKEGKMLNEPAGSSDYDHSSEYKTRIGMYMFILYALIYAGFVIINVTNAILMEKIIFFGLNLAVVYGFGLIIFALILALIYNHMCAKKESEMSKAAAGDSPAQAASSCDEKGGE